MQKVDFYEKSPERNGNHVGSSIDGGVTTSQNKVVVTSVSVEQANATQSGFNKQPRS